MNKLIAFLIFVLAFAPVIAGAIPPSPPIVVQEVDGTPYGAVSKFVFTNGTVTLSAGVATIDITGGAGQPITLIAGGETKSENLGGITVTNDTNSIFTESSADVLGIDVSKRWPTADVANAGDSATAFFSEGTIEDDYLPVASGTTAGIAPTTSGVTDGWVLTVQADESVAWEASSAGVTTIAAATDTAISDPAEANILIWDGSDSWDNKAVSGDVTIAATGAVTIGAEKILESHLAATDSATDEDVLTFEGTGFEWHSRNEIASGATIVTYADGALVDMSGITHDGTNDEGLTLPFWADVTPAASATKRFIAWDEVGANLKVMTATGWANFSTGTAPTDSGYLLIGSSPLALTADRILTEGTGIDLTDAGANSTLTVAVDTTEIGDTTWGSGSAITWTFNASGGTDPTIAAGDGGFAITGTLSVTGALAANGGITMGTGDGFTVNSVNLLSGDELDGTKIKDADYGDVTINADGAWAVEDDSHAHGSTTITLASTNLSDTTNVARLDADNTFTGTTNTVGNANTDILAVQSTLRGVGRAVSIDDDTTTAPTYATGTNELFVEGDIETDGTVYAASLNTGTGTDGSRAITMTTNTALSPAGDQLYFINDAFYFSQAGVQKTPMRLEDAQTVAGLKTFQNGLYLGDASTATVLRLYDGSSNYWTVAVPAMSGNYTLTLPADDGTANQVLTTDGSGATSWASPTATAAGAAAGMVQYNATGAGGALNASAHFIYTEPSAALLTIGSEGTGKTGNLALAYEGGASDYTVTIAPNSSMAADITVTMPSYATTLLGSGANTFSGVQTYSANEAAITHSGTTSLTIASTSGTVIVEGVTFTGAAVSGVSDLTTTGDTIIGDDLSLTSDGAVINIGAGNDVTITHSANTLTLGGGNLALGANNLTMTGDIAATGARVTKGWFAALESTAIPSVNGVAGNATNGLVTNPMSAAGDMIYGGASGATTRLAVAGQPGYTLTSGTTAGGTTPLWQAPGAAGTVYRGAGTTTTPTWSTSTFADTYAIGTLLHASGANTVTGLAAGASTEILVGSTGAAPVWTTATGTGAPVRADTPTLITPVIGAATGTSLIATGVVDGLTNVTLTTDGSEDANVTGKMSHVIINKHTTEATAFAVTLPATAVAGMQLLVKNGYGDDAPTTGVITVYVPATHYAWNPTTKTQCAQGYDLVSGGAAGDFIGMVAISDTVWESFGAQGTWTCTVTP